MERHSVKKGEYVYVILCLLAVAIMPLYLYGTRVITVMLAAVAAGIVADFICVRFFARKRWEKHDFSFIVTSLVVALLMPATVPLWVVATTVCISIIIAKHPFGGNGHTIFNPAAVGLAFSAICWPEYVLRYPTPGITASITDPSLIMYSESAASILHVGGTPKIEYFDVMLGKFAGPMGATCMIVLAGCLLFLVLMRVAHLKVVLPALLVVGLAAIFLPRVSTGEWSSLIYEGSSGALIFGLIFMTSDPVTLPKTRSGKILYGLIIGTTIVIFRRFGQVELDFVYAILIANIFAIPCDRYSHFIIGKFDVLRLKRKAHKLGVPYAELLVEEYENKLKPQIKQALHEASENNF